MALGDTYNNNDKNKNYSPSVASAVRFGNPESNIDKTALTFTYWNKLLKISIAPRKDKEDGTIAYDHDNAGSIYLSHSKALMLHKEIENFRKDPSAVRNVGVSSGKEGLIYICNGTEFGAEGHPCLVIRKINENGQSTAMYVYEFRRQTHMSIVDYDEKSANFESKYYDLLEVEQVSDVLYAYYTAMTMATAYSVVEVQKYDTSRMNTKLKVIADKLGVDFRAQNSNTRSNNSYFSSANKPSNDSNYGTSTTYESGSLDDLAD